MVVYFDTSILVNVYVPQPTGTPDALTLVRNNSPAIITQFAVTELKNAIRRLRFQGNINDQQLSTTLQAIDSDLQTQLYEVRSVSWKAVFNEAEKIGDNITGQYGIRTLDLMHLAIAVETGTTAFYTADQRQFDAAKTLGMVAHKP